MFVAKVAGHMVCTLGGIKIPVSRSWGRSIGLQYLDCETAMQACAAHFEAFKTDICADEDFVNTTAVAGSRLAWSDMQGRPNVPFSLVQMTGKSDLPDILTFHILYTVHELQLWDVGKR